MTNKNVPPEVSAFFREIGVRNGKKLFEDRGSEYFSKISKMRKTFGRQVKPVNEEKEVQTQTGESQNPEV